jgi:hypothetical protein
MAELNHPVTLARVGVLHQHVHVHNSLRSLCFRRLCWEKKNDSDPE